MNNKKLLLGIIVPLTIFGISSIVSADDIDCSTIDRDQIKELLDKQKSGEDLTTDESAILENAKQCMPEKPEMTGSGDFMRGPNKTGTGEFMKGMKPEMTGSGDLMKGPKSGSGEILMGEKKYNVSTKYKNTLDKSVESYMNKISNYDDDKKLEKLEQFATKVETLKTKINSSNYSESKKETYNGILEYLLEQINNEMDNISGEEDIDDSDILNEIFE